MTRTWESAGEGRLNTAYTGDYMRTIRTFCDRQKTLLTDWFSDRDHIGDINKMIFDVLAAVETGGAGLFGDRLEIAFG